MQKFFSAAEAFQTAYSIFPIMRWRIQNYRAKAAATTPRRAAAEAPSSMLNWLAALVLFGVLALLLEEPEAEEPEPEPEPESEPELELEPIRFIHVSNTHRRLIHGRETYR